MMINDPLSDMIARIKNAATRKRSTVLTPASKLRQRVAQSCICHGFAKPRPFCGRLVGKPGVLPLRIAPCSLLTGGDGFLLSEVAVQPRGDLPNTDCAHHG